jgi:hypothetical protein
MGPSGCCVLLIGTEREISRVPGMGSVMERLERSGREPGRQPVQKLPGKRLRHLLRAQVVVVHLPFAFFCATAGTPAAAPSWPSSSVRAHACAVAGETGGGRVQAQRKQAWCRSPHRQPRLLSSELLHARPLRPSDFQRATPVRRVGAAVLPPPPPPRRLDRIFDSERATVNRQ